MSEKYTVNANGKAISNLVTAALLADLMRPANVATSQAIDAARAFESVEGLLDAVKGGNPKDTFELVEGDKVTRRTTRPNLIDWITGALACGAIRDGLDSMNDGRGAIERLGSTRKVKESFEVEAF